MPTIRSADPASSIPDRDDGYDYDAADSMIVSDREQLRALADGVRTAILARLREQARSTQQLSQEMGIPKGTVGHHLKVLERTGLIRVVRTRRVRAVTEKFYGRTARFFRFVVEDPHDERALVATSVRQAAAEIDAAPQVVTFGHIKTRLRPADAKRFEQRLKRPMADMRAADTPKGKPSALIAAVYERGHG